MIITYPIDLEPESSGSGAAIVYDEAQDLTDEQRIQALENIGITFNEAGEAEIVTPNGTKRILLNDPPA